ARHEYHRLRTVLQPEPRPLTARENDDFHDRWSNIHRAAARTAASEPSSGAHPSDAIFAVSYSTLGTSPIHPRSPPVKTISASRPDSSTTISAIRLTVQRVDPPTLKKFTWSSIFSWAR